MEIDAVSRAYIVAGLRIGQDIEGFVDAYHGPEELAETASQITDPATALDLLDSEISDLESGYRKTYLETQARAMRTTVELMDGRRMPYLDEVEATFGIRPEHTPESVFEQVHADLDRLLPGSGSLRERRDAYRQQFVLEQEQIIPLSEQLQAELRRRTQQIIDLPEGEAAHIQLVSDEPWGGYNWYLGNLQSRIDINTDLPVHASSLPDLIAHEIYCGHHTEHSLKEQHWLKERGYGEAAIALLTSPQAVISEGIATVAFDSLVPEAERIDWLGEYCYQPAGIEADIEVNVAVQRASKLLGYVDSNAALLLHAEGRPKDEVVEYISSYGLRTEDEARQQVRFITTPILRCYIFNYTSGEELVSTYLDQAGDREKTLRSILTEHWTPARLQARAR